MLTASMRFDFVIPNSVMESGSTLDIERHKPTIPLRCGHRGDSKQRPAIHPATNPLVRRVVPARDHSHHRTRSACAPQSRGFFGSLMPSGPASDWRGISGNE